MRAKISAYIPTLNEEEKIVEAIQSVLWADEIIVVDSYSTDRTVELSKLLGAKVIQTEFRGFGNLRNFAIENCSYDWILSLDADERCTEGVKEEIEKILSEKDTLDAYFIPRKNFFFGKEIIHSGFYPDYRQPQLFKKGVLRFTDEPVHESYSIISDKPVGYLSSAIIQIPYRNLEELLAKANRYSTLGAEKLSARGVRPGLSKALFHGLWSFFHLYILKRGFLDGWPGFLIALGNFEGTFYKYAKHYERSKGLLKKGL